jgi:uncharacterized protein with ATP-grasp and redox domains
MKASEECYPCLQRLVYQAAELATKDTELRAKAIKEGLRVVEENFSYDVVTIVIAAQIYRTVKELTGNPDPYRQMKDEEVRLSQELLGETGSRQDFRDCLALSALGNSMDFFRDFDILRRDMNRRVGFVQDDSEELERRLKSISEVLYLADNAGEVFFDIPLVRWMENYAAVTYVVKGSPVQNDITLEDLQRYDLESEFKRMITTGSDAPGVDFSLASPQFRHEFESANLVFAKGMGFYETLSELPAQGRVFHCLMAKCKPVARSLGIPLDSYVAMLR